MQTSTTSTLDPERSRDALQKLRAAADTEAASVPPGVISVVGGDVSFDKEQKPIPRPSGDPSDEAGAARYPGQNSEHIGNGSGGPQ